MKLNRFSFTFLLLLPFSTFAFAAEDINVQLRNPNEVEAAKQQLLKQIEDSKAKVILLAEDHRDDITKDFYKTVIQAVAEKAPSSPVCYFLEIRETAQPGIDQLNAHDPDTIQYFHDFYREITKTFKEIMGRFPSHNLNLQGLAELKEKGVKIFTIDHDKSREELIAMKKDLQLVNSFDPAIADPAEERLINKIFRERNPLFGARIKEAFSQYQCSTGFFSVGTLHVFGEEAEPPIPSVDEELLPELSSLKIYGHTCDQEMKCKKRSDASMNILFYP